MLRNNNKVLYYKPIVFLQYRGLSPRLWTSSGRTLTLSCKAGHDQQLQGQDLKKPLPLSLQNTVQWFSHTSFRKIFWGHTGTKASDDLKWNTNQASYPLLSFLLFILDQPTLTLLACSHHSLLPAPSTLRSHACLGLFSLQCSLSWEIPSWRWPQWSLPTMPLPSFLHSTTWYLWAH